MLTKPNGMVEVMQDLTATTPVLATETARVKHLKPAEMEKARPDAAAVVLDLCGHRL